MPLVTHAGLAMNTSGPGPASPSDEFNQKIAQIDLETATINNVIALFGEPLEYQWDGQTYSKNNLPPAYLALYFEGFQVLVQGQDSVELRFNALGYLFQNTVHIGSSLSDALAVVTPPSQVIQGQPNGFVPGILYKDIDGTKGLDFYSSREDRVRIFFENDLITALYLVRSTQFPSDPPIQKFDDVRRIQGQVVQGGKDVSQLDLSAMIDVLPTLTFNQKTVWPPPPKMPAFLSPEAILNAAMNPGLGIHGLHQKGVTGKGVSVAVIDQPLYLDHPEFAGKIAAYTDFDCQAQSSMHGPAVASLLVGAKIGTAPDATLYYAAVPSWEKDAQPYAKALEWIVQENTKLPQAHRIRVVSVSAAPSGPASPFTKNNQMWDQAVASAEQAGLLVLDCTEGHGFIGPCWFSGADWEDPACCTPGFPGQPGGGYPPGLILAPASPRTTAEEYDQGDFGFQYNGKGGLSWAIPYVAGVLALGWQTRPDLDAMSIVGQLFQTAYASNGIAKIIHPAAFLNQLTGGVI
jgi:serine protease AprX